MGTMDRMFVVASSLDQRECRVPWSLLLEPSKWHTCRLLMDREYATNIMATSRAHAMRVDSRGAGT